VVVACMFGCSSFNREWEKAAASPSSGIEGAWVGRWESDAGHGGGDLKCLLMRKSPSEYQARFYATYWAVFRFHTQVVLPGEDRGAAVKLSGKEDLGWLRGGVFEYEGEVNAGDFACTYRSKHDEGTFKMKRPATAAEAK